MKPLRKRDIPRRLRGTRPRPPVGPANTLAAAFEEEVSRWEAAIASVVDQWERRNPVRARLDSKWIREKIKLLSAEIDGADKRVLPAIEKVAARVVKSVKVEKTVLTRVTMRGAPGVAIDAYRAANVARIKSIAQERLWEFSDLLDEAEAGGWRVERLAKAIREQFDVSRSKAKLLAKDQTLKLGAAITKERQTQSGITRYIWSTSGDERVREGHRDLDGTVQSWDDPPDTGDGERNHPGEDYQCRCVAIPVLPDLSADEEPED